MKEEPAATGSSPQWVWVDPDPAGPLAGSEYLMHVSWEKPLFYAGKVKANRFPALLLIALIAGLFG